MSKNLLIVESPAKASTIEKILGEDFKVASSYGHVRDLPKSGMSIDTEDTFLPVYEVPAGKKKVVSELKKLVKNHETVWLATDEDREGEAISWHLAEVLKLDPDKTKRIVFHEITRPAILNAVENPRSIDMNLVNAQQARRVLDRLVGYELSPVLWRKVKTQLSAGRVQSVAVRILVEREREIEAFVATSAYRIRAIFDLEDKAGKKYKMEAELPKRFQTKEEAYSFLSDCNGANFSIADIEVKPGKKTPSAPFTTSSLQQEASRKLGFSVVRTMTVAQKLYESGKITYMRTDSVNLSDTAKSEAAQAIENGYGKEYVQNRNFKNKSSGAQEAHEAIRPTSFESKTVEGDDGEQKLYQLIWRRAIASQMSDAQVEKTNVKITISTREEQLVAKGEVLTFDGFLKVYEVSKDEDERDEPAGMLPPVEKGQELSLNELTGTERFSRPPSRFTEASLVKKLEELGIGRPSTYAPTITTIQRRGYVEKRGKDGVKRDYIQLELKDNELKENTLSENTGAESSKLFPTDVGKLMSDFLLQHFQNIMDYEFTARVENALDSVADGNENWNQLLKEFYDPFHENVEKTIETAERASGERELGTDPKSGRPVLVRMGRFGPLAQIGKPDDEEKPKHAGLRTGQSIETITLEEALKLFDWPRVLGELDGQEVKANIGRFGPYVQLGSVFASIKKDAEFTVENVTYDQAVELIRERQKVLAERLIHDFPDEGIQVLKGRWGPFIKKGRENYKLTKEQKEGVESLTLKDIMEIIENAEPPKKKKATKKKTPAKKKK